MRSNFSPVITIKTVQLIHFAVACLIELVRALARDWPDVALVSQHSIMAGVVRISRVVNRHNLPVTLEVVVAFYPVIYDGQRTGK
jgi:hypothetical protein